MLKKIIIIIILISFLTGNEISKVNMPVLSATVNTIKTKGIAGRLIPNVINSNGVNDPYYNRQWSVDFTKSGAAWKIVKQKKIIKIALVDSGVDYNHPDLKNRVSRNLGYNFISNNMNVMDDLGHGTQVAGVIAAQQGNKEGITGIVGALNVKIIPIKVLDNKGRGPSDIVARGIIYGADMGADVINVSIDFDNHDEDIQYALSYATNKGALVVVASGNSSSNCDKYSPAGDYGAYTVASINQDYKRPDFSSFGSSVKVAAPGVSILTTSLKGKYTEETGTSMSAPIVTGIAAMIKAQNPNLSPEEIGNLINSTATDVLNKGKDKLSGYGLVNAYKAVIEAK